MGKGESMTIQRKRYEVIDKKTHVIYKDNMTSMIHSVPKNKEAA